MDGMTYLTVLLLSVTAGALAISALGHWMALDSDLKDAGNPKTPDQTRS